ncbi:MAG: hypothetical protein MUF10_16480 [Thermoanaerobaculaceae bacterium]|nr:hypothetical protein [Thermoanaerobaculaceae bacterium]
MNKPAIGQLAVQPLLADQDATVGQPGNNIQIAQFDIEPVSVRTHQAIVRVPLGALESDEVVILVRGRRAAFPGVLCGHVQKQQRDPFPKVDGNLVG